VPLRQQDLKWVRMSACCVKQIQNATTKMSRECSRKNLMICAPKIEALDEKFEAVKLMVSG